MGGSRPSPTWRHGAGPTTEPKPSETEPGGCSPVAGHPHEWPTLPSEPVDPPRCTAKQGLAFAGVHVAGHALERVPQHGVVDAPSVHREVAFKHAAIYSEGLNAPPNERSPGVGRFLRRHSL